LLQLLIEMKNSHDWPANDSIATSPFYKVIIRYIFTGRRGRKNTSDVS